MMKFLMIIILISWDGLINAQSNYFNLSYDSPNLVENGNSVLQMQDKGFLIASASYDYSNFQIPALYLIRTNMYGDTIWTKSVMKGDIGLEPIRMKMISQDRIIVGGNAICCNGLCAFYFLSLIDTLGDTLWVKTYKSSGYHYSVFADVIATSDNGFLAVGDASITDSCSYLGTGYGTLAQAIKLDSNGNIEWQKYFGGDSLTFSEAYGVVETNLNSFILCGSSSINDSYQVDDGFILALDHTGDLMWQKTYGNYGVYDGFKTIFKAPDNNYYLGGYEQESDHDWREWMMEINSNGEDQWDKVYSPDSLESAEFRKGLVAEDGNIYFIGNETKRTAQPSYGVLMKLSPQGDSLFNFQYRGDTGFYYMNQFYKFGNYTYDIQQTSDSGFIIVGSDHPYTQDAWLLKLDQYGCLMPGCVSQTIVNHPPDTVKVFSVFPNPATTQLQITLPQSTQPLKLTALNLLGETVLTKQLNPKQTTLDISTLAKGVYILQAQCNGQDYFQEFIKQ